MKLVLLLTLAVLASVSPVPLGQLNLNYLPPTKPFEPPAESYLPPSNSYVYPSISQHVGSVAENRVNTGEPEEAPVEEVGASASAEVAVAEEAAPEAPVEAEGASASAEVAVTEEAAPEAPVEAEAPEAPVEAEAPVEEAAVEAAAVKEDVVVEGEVEDGSQPKSTPFYDDEEEEQAEEGSLKVDQLHGVEGSYELREEGQGHRNTEAREENKLYQHVEDVKTFNSEVHEYEYYPYESYGKQVTVVEPIIGKTYGFHAVPYQAPQPGHAPFRSVFYAPAQYPAYKHGPVYRNPSGYTREPSRLFPGDGSRYITHPPRPAETGVIGYGAGGEQSSLLGNSGRYIHATSWPAYNAQAVFPAGSGFLSAPIFAGSYSGESEYGSQWAESAAGEAEAATSGAEAVTSGAEAVTSGAEAVTSGAEAVISGEEVVTSGAETSASSVSEAGDSVAEAVTSVSEGGQASAEASASISSEGESSRVEASASGTANDGESSAEASASTDSDQVASSSAVASRRISSGQIPYTYPLPSAYPAAPVWWPVSQYPANTYQPAYADPSAAYSPHSTAATLYQNPVPAASTTQEVLAAPPADSDRVSGLSRRRSVTGGLPQHAAVSAVASAVPAVPVTPPVEHDLVYAAGAVLPRGAYRDGSRHVREGNIPGYYVRCVRHDSGPPSVSLVPFAQ